MKTTTENPRLLAYCAWQARRALARDALAGLNMATSSLYSVGVDPRNNTLALSRAVLERLS